MRPIPPPDHSMDVTLMFCGVLFSSIGLGFFIYGKRQQAPVPLVCGIAVMVFPYFVSSVWAMVLVGAALIAIPYFVRI